MGTCVHIDLCFVAAWRINSGMERRPRKMPRRKNRKGRAQCGRYFPGDTRCVTDGICTHSLDQPTLIPSFLASDRRCQGLKPPTLEDVFQSPCVRPCRVLLTHSDGWNDESSPRYARRPPRSLKSKVTEERTRACISCETRLSLKKTGTAITTATVVLQTTTLTHDFCSLRELCTFCRYGDVHLLHQKVLKTWHLSLATNVNCSEGENLRMPDCGQTRAARCRKS